MNSDEKKRLDELKEKNNNGEDLTPDEKRELDKLIEQENQIGGNPLAQPEEEDDKESEK